MLRLLAGLIADTHHAGPIDASQVGRYPFGQFFVRHYAVNRLQLDALPR